MPVRLAHNNPQRCTDAMRVIHDLNALESNKDLVLTIGTFDGVHRGHQHLLAQLVGRAQESGRMSAVLTFCPHPRSILHPEERPDCLTTPEERAALIEASGLDLLVLLPFTQRIADTTAKEFVQTLYRQLNMREIWVSEGFAMGRRREGNVSELRELSQRSGFALRVIEPLFDQGKPISSTRIRKLLTNGQVREASRLLGRNYTLSNLIVGGAQRGRTMGFPTANLSLPAYRAIPANGVYAVWASMGQTRLRGVANIGTRPTFDAGERRLEVHLLDHKGDVYGETLTVEFVQRLRAERRFDDAAALVEQIRHDIAKARETLNEGSRNGQAP